MWNEEDKFLFDLIALKGEKVDLSHYPKSDNLLKLVYKNNKILYSEDLEVIRSRVKNELKRNYKKQIKISKTSKKFLDL